jgi:hypothetical protein
LDAGNLREIVAIDRIHYPELDEVDIIEYNPGRDIVRFLPNEQLESVLDSVSEAELKPGH